MSGVGLMDAECKISRTWN